MLVIMIVLFIATVPPLAPSLDKKCFAEYQAEHYTTSANVCEQAARAYDAEAMAETNHINADLDRFTGATLRMEAAWSNYVNNKDDLAFNQANAAIYVFSSVASSKTDPPNIVTEAKRSLQDAKKQLAIMKANP